MLRIVLSEGVSLESNRRVVCRRRMKMSNRQSVLRKEAMLRPALDWCSLLVACRFRHEPYM